jgi:hypothetical protein
MKKLSFIIILSAIVTNAIQAQNAGIRFANYENENRTGPVPDKVEVTGLNGSAATINDVNLKAVRDFSKSCQKAENIHWYIDAKATFAYYYVNGNKGWRVYDKKGNFVYNMDTYPEKFLPYDIRDQVKRTYYLDYNIIWVQEIQTEGKTIYIVHLTNKTTWLNVRVGDGEMDVLEEYNK